MKLLKVTGDSIPFLRVINVFPKTKSKVGYDVALHYPNECTFLSSNQATIRTKSPGTASVYANLIDKHMK